MAPLKQPYLEEKNGEARKSFSPACVLEQFRKDWERAGEKATVLEAKPDDLILNLGTHTMEGNS